MRKIYFAIFMLALASCKKDPAPKPRPVAQQPARQDTLSLEETKVAITSVDLAGVGFIPSSSPLVFSSIATGRPSPDGGMNRILLSSSGWTHPSVVHFKDRWNGYCYWAAVTPYPNADNQYENPHIFVSDDGISWKEPAGIHNPIEPCPAGAAYNSDVNLMYSNGTMYCYWRMSGVFGGRALYAVTSSDGIHWANKQMVGNWALNLDVIAPSVVKVDDRYHCYGICTGEEQPGTYYNTICIRKMISSDPLSGFTPQRENGYTLIRLPGRPWGIVQEPWHIEVQKVSNIWLMLVTTTNLGGYGSGGRLFMGYSLDGLNFEFSGKPVCTVNGSTYKSSFHPVLDIKNRQIKVEMWRAMMSGGWTIFHDTFSMKVALSPIV